MPIQPDDIKMTFKVLNYKELKAIVSLDFGDFVVRGFRIQSSKFKTEEGDNEPQDGLWVTPPSYVDKNGKYHPIFFMPDKESWEIVRTRIVEEFSFVSEEQERKKYGLPKEENTAEDNMVEGIQF